MSDTRPSTKFGFTIRRATFNDLPSLARTSTLAFWNDVLFSSVIHPRRHHYPSDCDTYWLKRFQCSYWDWSQVFLVATSISPPRHPELAIPEFADDPGEKSLLLSPSGSEERVVGVAHWSRAADVPRTHPLSNYSCGMALPWWSPLRLLKPVLKLYWSVLTRFHMRRNRAADPEQEDVLERSYSFLDHVWTPANRRDPVWYLESLAVRPEYQSCGIGRDLVRWGLDKAEKEGICCSVVSAKGKERFYQRCGFDVGPVGWSGEGEGNPLGNVPGGLIYVREAKDVRDGTVIRAETRRRGKMFGDVEVEFV